MADASLRVDTILASLLKDDIRNQDFANQLNDRVAYSEGFLVELCGQPLGCDILTEEGAPSPGGDCEVSWRIGVCGFDQPKGPEEDREPKNVIGFESAASPSLAGLAIKAVKAATIDEETARSSLVAFVDASKAMESTTKAFAANITRWNAEATTNAAKIDAILTQETGRQSTLFNARLARIAESQKRWEDAIARRKGAADGWDIMWRTNAGGQEAANVIIATSSVVSDVADKLGSGAADVTGNVINGTPKALGLASDVFAPLRMAIGFAGSVSKSFLTAAGVVAKRIQTYTQLAASIAQLEFEKNLSIAEYQEETAAMQRETDEAIAELNGDRDEAADPVVAARIEQLISNLDRRFEILQGLERDTDELYVRRNELKSRAVEMVERTGALLRANLAVQTASLEYYRLCELAAQEKSALDMVRGFRSSIHQLIAGPQALFATANSLTEGERELDRARAKMADWLVAIEFAAVRPFFDERMAILLARNTYQLRAIADRLRDLESRCGGPTNIETATVSVRDDLLYFVNGPQLDIATKYRLLPASRFAQIATTTPLPADLQMRYSASQTLEEGMRGTSANDLLIMKFEINADRFANLSRTCNAKLESIKVKLTGTGFILGQAGLNGVPVVSSGRPSIGDGIGGGQPVVTILAGGASSMLSCQPGIDAYVRTFAPDWRQQNYFGSKSQFVTERRAFSSVAGLNEMGPPNLSLAGLPLASDYTLIIDTKLEANRAVNWRKLADIELELTYSYQDVFAATSDCANAL